METRSRLGHGFRCVVICAIIALCLLVAACGHDAPLLREKSETEIAVSAYKDEWLKKCDGPESQMPENETGALLQDYTDLAKAFAICKARHNDSRDYLEPVVSKERTAQH